MAKCRHETATPFWGDDGTATVFVCVASGCGAIGVRSVGPANDADASRVEILAAEVGQSPSVWVRYQDCDREIDRTLDDMGVRGTFGLGAGSPRGAHLDLDPPAQWTPRDVEDYLAGWLAVRQAESHLEKDEGYDWDVTRPHEGQLEEWFAVQNYGARLAETDAVLAADRREARDALEQAATRPIGMPDDDTTCPACGEAPEDCTAGVQSDAEHPDLVTFADGEATPEQAAATRDHLASCEPCGKEFVDVMQLGARLSTLEPVDDRFGHASDDPPEPPMPRCAKDGAMLVDGECTVCKWNGTVEP